MPSSANSVNRYSIFRYQLERQNFSLKVYGLTAIFVLITIIQWILIMLITGCHWIFYEHFYITTIGLMVALIGVTYFSLLEQVRFLFPVNWILVILIIEGVTIGMARHVIETNIKLFGICFLMVLLLVVSCIMIGIKMPHDLTLDVVIMFVVVIVFFFGAIVLLILYIQFEFTSTLYIYASFVLVTVVLFIMYHAQTIKGGRYAEMRLNDYLLATLLVYHDFIILFAMAFYVTTKILEESNN